MIDIAGRRVKFAAGRGKSQSVNICTVDGTPGVYEWVLVVDGSQIESEAELAAFRGNSIEAFVNWVRETYGATMATSRAVTTKGTVAGARLGTVTTTRTAEPTGPGDGIFAGVDDFIDRSLGIDGVGSAPHHRHRRSALQLSRAPVAGLDPWPFVAQLYATVEGNGLRSVRTPSVENWRVRKMTDVGPNNPSEEKQLEKAMACDLGPAWTNQMPTASGLVTSGERQRNVDLVRRVGAREFEFIELKVGSDTPLYAAFEILKNGLTYLYSRRRRTDLGYCESDHAPLWADVVHLRVLAPESYYDGYDFAWLEPFLNAGLARAVDPTVDGALRMDFCFEHFPAEFVPSARGPSLAAAVARRERVYPA